MEKFSAVILLAPFALFGVSSCAEDTAETAKSDTYFTVTGDVSLPMVEARASIVKLGGKIPAMTISSTSAAIKKFGSSYGANLFFSNDFTPKPGTYPIEFGYRNRKDTLGGSFTQRRGMFSHDTKGTAEFIEFGDKVKVVFEFQSFNGNDKKADRKMVTVKGEAVCDCPYTDIF